SIALNTVRLIQVNCCLLWLRMGVSSSGDLANWMIPGKKVKGMGGAMDLVAGVQKVVVLMEHNAKDGSAKVVPQCTLPLTGKGVVNRVITDLGVMDITERGVILVELAKDVTLEQIKAATGVELITDALEAA
ncbi:MAG: CoA-transferase, partial [Acinetobacter sp.]